MDGRECGDVRHRLGAWLNNVTHSENKICGISDFDRLVGIPTGSRRQLSGRRRRLQSSSDADSHQLLYRNNYLLYETLLLEMPIKLRDIFSLSKWTFNSRSQSHLSLISVSYNNRTQRRIHSFNHPFYPVLDNMLNKRYVIFIGLILEVILCWLISPGEFGYCWHPRRSVLSAGYSALQYLCP